MSLYTTLAAANLEFGTPLVTDLADLDEDGSADAGGVSAKIVHVGNLINLRLGARWPVPFADDPSTPPEIQTIATYLLVARLLLPRHDETEQRQKYEELAEAMLVALEKGTGTITGVDPLPAASASRGFKSNEATPVFIGLDEYGEDRMKNW
jgi:hypothetical protein